MKKTIPMYIPLEYTTLSARSCRFHQHNYHNNRWHVLRVRQCQIDRSFHVLRSRHPNKTGTSNRSRFFAAFFSVGRYSRAYQSPHTDELHVNKRDAARSESTVVPSHGVRLRAVVRRDEERTRNRVSDQCLSATSVCRRRKMSVGWRKKSKKFPVALNYSTT